MFLHGVASDRVYIVKPMSPWAGWALTPPFHPCRNGEAAPAVYLCCTCPGVTPGGRYPLSLPCEARTFLTWCLSASSRGCPTWLRTILYCKQPGLSNPLANSFHCGYTIRRYEIQDTRYKIPRSCVWDDYFGLVERCDYEEI